MPRNEQIYGGPASPDQVEVTGFSSIRTLSMSVDMISVNQTDIYPAGCTASSQHVAVADALATTGMLWAVAMANTSTKGHGSPLEELDVVHSITAGYYQPYTSVKCDQDLIEGPNDTDPVAFPAYTGIGAQMVNAFLANSPNFLDDQIFPNLTKSDIWDTHEPSSDYRLRWVELPSNGTAIGAITLRPRSPQNTTQELLMCNIGAGWGLSTVKTSTANGAARPTLSQADITTVINTINNDGGGAISSDLAYSTTQLKVTLGERLFLCSYFPRASCHGD